MAEVPTVPGSEYISTPSKSVKADFGQLNAANVGRAQFAGTLEQVGQDLGQFAIHMQRAVNYSMLADADREMRQAAADFQQSRIGRTDEDQWVQQWDEKSNETYQKITQGQRLGPEARKQLNENFANWKSANAIEVRTIANQQMINRSVDRIGLDADEAAKDGDEAGIEAVFQGAVDHQLMLPEVAQKMKDDYLRKIDVYQARNFMMNNPSDAADFIEEKDKSGKYMNLTRLTPDERMTLANAARQQFTKYQQDNYQGLISDLQNGVVRTPNEMNALVQQKVITATQRKSYDTAYRHGNFNTSADDIGSLFTDINKYDPTDDPKFEQRAKLMARVATSGFPQNVQSDMNQLLGQKASPVSVLNSPIAKDAFQGIDQRFRLGLYGKYEDRVTDDLGNFKTIVHPDIYESAMIIKRRVEDATRKFLTENPNATASQVNDFVANVQMTNITQAGRKTLLNGMGFTPAKVDTPAEFKARLDDILSKGKK